MTHKPAHWTETDLSWQLFVDGAPLAVASGWTFLEHPELGDEHHILAMSLDIIGPNGPVVYDTGDYDVPEFM